LELPVFCGVCLTANVKSLYDALDILHTCLMYSAPTHELPELCRSRRHSSV